MADNDPEEIKRAVLGRYSAHARRRLASLEKAGGSCCGPAQPQASDSSCCGEQPSVSETSSCACSPAPPAEAARNNAANLYAMEELGDLPEDVLSSLGCGNPTAIAGLREGEAVLDLGSGGGLDCFLAAKKV